MSEETKNFIVNHIVNTKEETHTYTVQLNHALTIEDDVFKQFDEDKLEDQIIETIMKDILRTIYQVMNKQITIEIRETHIDGLEDLDDQDN